VSKTWYGHHIDTIKGTDYVLFKDYLELDKEIERLNNIINELEKYLEEIKDRVIMYGIDDDTYKTTNLYRDIKNKIKELKGSDKE